MRVVEVTEFGGPEVLHVAERPDPAPGAEEVVVAIEAATVNPTDLSARSMGNRYISDLELPFVPGWDLAGTVRAVGDGVRDFAPGDRVCGMIPFGRIGGRVGAYAEAAAVKARWLAPLPDGVDFADGATLPLNALTAGQALRFFDLEPGARLLITGASGGVGGFAVRLALRAGLHVIGVAGRDDEAWVDELGAHEVLPRDADLADLEPVDGVFDAVPLGPAQATPALRRHGTAVFTRPPQPADSDRARFETVHVQSDTDMLREMAELLGEGELRTRVARELAFDDAPEAHRLAEAGGLHGKVILRP